MRCDCCLPEQVCHSSFPYVRCLPKPIVGADQFSCLTKACDLGDVCVQLRPPGDSVYADSCVAPPTACELVTCACLEANIDLSVIYGCEETDGNFTVTGY
jgi:hypothetical protein